MKVLIDTIPLAFLHIPAGNFLMGSSRQEIAHTVEGFPHLEAAWFEKEYPQHEVDVPEFYMAETLITNAQWHTFMRENNITRKPLGFDIDKPDHPVWDITFEELSQFCEWLSKKSGYNVKIPTEAQWEKAARGTDKREYPWGNIFNGSLCNTKESGRDSTAPV
ncbi:MAG TPA: SUMF1/EgtB/PvdO family nonheme iron enzyme, partial [Candidatus Saccharimonadales bacterium]